MKRALLFFVLLLTLTRPSAGQITFQSLTFDDRGLGGGTATSGTYNSNDTFSFDVLLTFNRADRDILGLSFWLETKTALAGSLSITGVTYGTTFPDPNATSPNPAFFNSGSGASPGYLAEARDLGSFVNDFFNLPGSGTYFVAHVTFSIAGAMPGTYDLASTIVSPKTSEVICSGGGLNCFLDVNSLPAEHYSITIVPEPATVGLLGLGGAGLTAILLRRRKR
jgi:PEP-CTERM motif-containing protein